MKTQGGEGFSLPFGWSGFYPNCNPEHPSLEYYQYLHRPLGFHFSYSLQGFRIPLLQSLIDYITKIAISFEIRKQNQDYFFVENQLFFTIYDIMITNIERQQKIAAYVEYLSTSSVIYEQRGKNIDAVFRFLLDADEVSRRGWLHYRKNHAEVLMYMPWMQDAVCDFLALQGIGFRQAKYASKKKNRNIDNIKKRDIRQKEIVNGFILWMNGEREYSPLTLQNYTFSVRDFYSYFDDFTQDNVRRYIAKMEDDGKSPKTIRLRITAMVKLSEYLKKPVRLRRPKLIKTLSTENIPSEKEYNKLLEYCDTHDQDLAYIIRLLGSTGCRVSELLQFTYEMIKEGSAVLKGKGAKYRRFFFSKRIQEGAKGKAGYVCINRYGGRLSSRGLDTRLKSLAEKTGVAREKMHVHAFRHFFAKMYLQKTKDVVGLAELLGHGSVDTTRIYLQKSYDEQKKEFNRTVTW